MKGAEMKRPNIFLHMIRWGFGSGTILGVVYLVMLETQVFDAIKILTYPDIWIFAAIFGVGWGIVLGFVDAVLLWFLIRFLPQILKSDLTQSDRFSVYAMILIIACNGWIGWLYLDSIATGIRYFSDMRLFSLYPSPLVQWELPSPPTVILYIYISTMNRATKKNAKPSPSMT